MNIKHLMEIVQWTARPITRHNLTNTTNKHLLKTAATIEKTWASKITRKNTTTWSGKLGEDIVKTVSAIKRTQGMETETKTRNAPRLGNRGCYMGSEN